MPVVLIILGSKSDLEIGKKVLTMLQKFAVGSDIVVASAHRTPERLWNMVRESDAKVFIAVAGLAAALPGAVASYTTKPVIGVPVSGAVNLDSILSIVQMPPGIPVAAVGLDRGENAADPGRRDAGHIRSTAGIGTGKIPERDGGQDRERLQRGASLMFDPKEFTEEKIEELKTSIKGKAIIACSGGVDSTAAAVLVSRAIGDRLLTIYVNNGFMRKGRLRRLTRCSPI